MRRRRLHLTETERAALLGILLIFLMGLLARQQHLRSLDAPTAPIQSLPRVPPP